METLSPQTCVIKQELCTFYMYVHIHMSLCLYISCIYTYMYVYIPIHVRKLIFQNLKYLGSNSRARPYRMKQSAHIHIMISQSHVLVM